MITAIGLGLLPVLLSAQNELEMTEMAKRKALVDEVRFLVAKGDEAMQEQRPDLAVTAYAGARDVLPNAPILEEMQQLILERYTVAALTLAGDLVNQGDLKTAKEWVERVLQDGIDPENASALKMREMLNNPIAVNQALTPEHHENVQEVVDLLQKADDAIMLGRFDLASRSYEKVLLIDPHNVAARRGLLNVVRHKEQAKIAGYDQTRAQMLLEVEQAWELEVLPSDDVLALNQNNADPAEIMEAALEAKLDQLIIPQVSFSGVSLEDAIEFLRVASSNEDVNSGDLNKRGINFNLNLGPEDSGLAQEIKSTPIDLKLKNVPIAEILRHITKMTGTAYKIDPYVVSIVPIGQIGDEVYMRQYPVPANFISLLEAGAGSPTGADPFAVTDANQGLLTERLPIRDLLKRKGISFGDGATANYVAASNTLIMVNTSKNHNIVEQIIEATKQEDNVIVKVAVTVLKVEQNTLEELGFDWMLNSVGLSSNPNVRMAGGTTGNSGGRFVRDFTSTGLLMGSADDIASNVITNGLRLGDRAITGDSLEAIINNPTRATQTANVAPGILSLSGFFEDGTGQAIMRGLSQKKGVDSMAKPEIVTRSGESAKIELIREFIYPTEYDPPQLQGGGGGGGVITGGPAFPVVPAHPTSFDTRNVGITLEVLATAGPNNNYISVNLNPELVEFEGFVNYGSPITTATTNALGMPVRVELTRNEILMPVFSTMRTSNQLIVADGATIIYGGLLKQNIQLVEDQVPVLGDLPWLGRMFQSRSYQPIKTAIIFSVTVDLVDPTGRKYRELGTGR